MVTLASAQEDTKVHDGHVESEIKVEVLLGGLDNPCGVAIEPGTGDLFVSDSAAGKIIRIHKGQASEVITDFPIDVYGTGPKYNIGPLGLAFLEKGRLVVGGGGFIDGKDLLRLYDVPAVGEKAITADKMAVNLGNLGPDDKILGEGNFYGVTINRHGIFTTCNGDDTKGWVAKTEQNGTKFTPLKRFIASKEATQVDAPVAITTCPKGFLAVGQMGEILVPGDSLLTYYHPRTGEKLANFKTGLSDITGLAYSPQENLLYALDFSWHDTSAGGLYRLDAKLDEKNQQEVVATKLLALDKATSLVFGDDGSLYVTVFGSPQESETEKGGQLLKITLPSPPAK